MSVPISRSTFSMRTGIATLGSIPPETQLDLALGTLSSDALTDPIVHELIHHNAANSPVNVALQYRWLELLRAALSTPDGQLDDRLAGLVGQLAATEALLQPIAEGLANFAEFDCCLPDLSDPGSIAHAVDLISLRLLSLKCGSVEESHRAAVSEKLSQAQTRRRADVLSHPLYPETMNDAYLLGYLIFKAAWNLYVEGDTATRWPAGAFTNYVHYWFYEDWRLAELLLHTGAAGNRAVVDHLSSRLRLLFSEGLAARVDAFVRDRTEREQRGMLPRGPEEREHGPLAGLELMMEDIVDAQYALVVFFLSRIGPGAPLTEGPLPHPSSTREELHNTIVEPLSKDQGPAVEAYFKRNPGTSGKVLRVLDFLLEMPRMNKARVKLLDLPIEVDVGDGALTALRVDADDAMWHEPPTAIKISVDASGRHRGRLLATASSKSSPWRLDCFVVVDNQVRATWSFGEPPPDEHREDVERINYYEAFRAESGISPEQYMSNALAGARLVGDDATIIVGMALREVLAERGWAGLFGMDPTADDKGVRTVLRGPEVSALSATGLVNSYSTDRTEVATRLAARGHDLDGLIAACDRGVTEHGVRLLDADAERVRARI